MNFFIPRSLTHLNLNGIEYVYNWDQGDFIEFDNPHPFLLAVKEGSLSIKLTNKDDISFLVENNYIFENESLYKKYKKKIFDESSNKVANSLNLIILPAGQGCNLACVYCYEDHSVNAKMGESEMDSLLKFIISECQSRNVNFINISYFGGEPLLNKRFIINFNQKIQELSSKFNFKFSSSMTTNGYLLDLKSATTLSELSLKAYQITLDGLESEHNSLRPLNNGKGSYKQILNNLKAIKNSNLEILVDIRVNFNESHSGSEYQSELIDFIKINFGSDSRFRVRFRPIGDYSNLNGKSSNSTASLCGKSIANAFQLDFEKVAFNEGLNLADISMLSECGAYSCYAGKANHYVIDSNLNVKMCTVALDVEINNVGLISNDGILVLNENHKLWLEKYGKESCGSCFFNTHCASSACPLVNMKMKLALCPPLIEYKQEWAERIVSFIERS